MTLTTYEYKFLFGQIRLDDPNKNMIVIQKLNKFLLDSFKIAEDEMKNRAKKRISELGESESRKLFGDLINYYYKTKLSSTPITPLTALIIRMTELLVDHPMVGGRIEELSSGLNGIKKIPNKDIEMFKVIWKFRQNVLLSSGGQLGTTVAINPAIIDWATAIDSRNNRPYLSNYGPIVIQSLIQKNHDDLLV